MILGPWFGPSHCSAHLISSVHAKLQVQGILQMEPLPVQIAAGPGAAGRNGSLRLSHLRFPAGKVCQHKAIRGSCVSNQLVQTEHTAT